MTATPTSTAAPTSCPHCGSTRISGHHFRDAGDASPERAERLGYCPILAARRGSTSFPLDSVDSRFLAREDAYLAAVELDLSDAYRAALAAEASK